MPEIVRGYCPACKQEVDYEVDQEFGGQTFCSICGRTQELAEKAEKLLRKQKARKKFRFAMKVLAGIVIVIFMGFSLLIDPERILGRGISTLKGMLVLSIPVVIIFAVVYYLIGRFKKK